MQCGRIHYFVNALVRENEGLYSQYQSPTVFLHFYSFPQWTAFLQLKRSSGHKAIAVGIKCAHHNVEKHGRALLCRAYESLEKYERN